VVLLAAMLTVPVTSQESSSEAFYTAIRANDLKRLGGMLTAGAGVNAKDERGITPLVYASASNSRAMVLPRARRCMHSP
jgi:hypothetical protein